MNKHIYSILKTSLPAALDLASQPIMWLIEAVFIGRLSAAALGGVGFALQIILVTITILLTFVMGASILINRELGSNNHWEANHIVGQTIMVSFILAVPVGLLWYFGSPLIFRIINEHATQSISGIDSGVKYLQLIALFSPVLIPNFIAVSLIRGAGDTHVSMVINLTMNIVNLVLSPILIYGLFGFPRMEVKGAAIAMGIAHTLGFIMTFINLRRKRSTLFLSFRELTTPNLKSFKQLFKVGLPTTVEQMVWSGGMLIVTGFVAMMGITQLAIHQLFARMQAVLSMIYMGFSLAAMSHVGKNIGANDPLLAQKTGRVTRRIVLLLGVIILIVLVVFSGPILHLFIRKEDAVIANFGFRTVFIIFALVQVPKALNGVISGSLRGAGEIQWLMWLNIITVLIFEVGVNWAGAFIFKFGLAGIWAVQFIDESVKAYVNKKRFNDGTWQVKLIK
ncbi:hypothetical protein DRQ07_00455 [candidate division KSB1 bacterium]|nr:MAG: hypothetical protein DRQ07_00455 [candidate division KSB1 bacterium]